MTFDAMLAARLKARTRSKRDALRAYATVLGQLGRLATFVVVDMRQGKKVFSRLVALENCQAAIA